MGDSIKFRLQWDPRAGPILTVKFMDKKIIFAFCHRQEDRCIKLFGHTSFLCARCTGMIIGFIPALILLVLNKTLPWTLSFVLIFPLIFDGLSQLIGIRKSTNLIRLITGILFVLGFLSLIKVI